MIRRAARWISLALALTGAVAVSARADDPAVSGSAPYRGVIISTAGTKVGTEKTINFIPGTNVTMTAADNPGQKRVDVTINSSGGGGGGGSSTLQVMQAGVQVTSPTATINFKAPLLATLNGSTTADVTMDSSSGTLQGNTFNIANKLALLNGSGFLPAVDIPAFTGDVTSPGGSYALTIAANAVSNAKFRQSAGLSVVGVAGNSTSNVADITGTANQALRVNGAGTSLGFGAIDLSQSAAATGILQAASHPALTGQVTTPSGSVVTTVVDVNGATGLLSAPQKVAISTGGVLIGNTTSFNVIPASNVTVTGSNANGRTDITIGLGANVTVLGSDIDLGSSEASGTLAAARFPALTGDVTNSAGSLATTIANNAVTNAKFRQGAALSVVGVTGNATANEADIVGTANQTLRVNGAGTALGFGALDVSQAAAVTGSLGTGNGGTGLSGATDDNTLVGNGSVWQSKALPACTDTSGNHLNYDTASNAFSCGTSVSIPASGVTAGTYGSATQVSSVTVGADGRVTSATNVTISLTNSNLQSGAYSNITSVANSGVTATTYGDASNVPQITIAADGRITSATNVAITGGSGTSLGVVLAVTNCSFQ